MVSDVMNSAGENGGNASVGEDGVDSKAAAQKRRKSGARGIASYKYISPARRRISASYLFEDVGLLAVAAAA